MIHKHHIIPKHATGGIANNHPDNIVELTVAEHAEAHRKLFEEHGRWQDKLAWMGLSGAITGEEARKLRVSLALKGNKFNVGRVRTEEEKLKRSLTLKGRKKSEKTKAKMRKPKSVEHRRNISLNHADFSGKNNPMYGKKRNVK